MAYRDHKLGALVRNDPAAAALKIGALFARYTTRAAVAAAVGVNVKTLSSWLACLASKGHADPRPAERKRRTATLDVRKKALALKARGFTPQEAAEAVGFSAKTVSRWFAVAS